MNKFTIKAKFVVLESKEYNTIQKSYTLPTDLSEKKASDYECKAESLMGKKKCDFDYSYDMHVEYDGKVYATVSDLFEYLKEL